MAVDATQAPELAPPAAAGTPDGAPPQAAPPAPVPDQPKPAPQPDGYKLLQADHTRIAQQNAAIKRELGLDTKASEAEVLAALRAQRAQEQGSDDDPVMAQREADFQERLWGMATTLYPEVAPAAREFAELVRSQGDPEAIVTAFNAAILRFGPDQLPPPETPPAAGTSLPPQPSHMEGDAPPSPDTVQAAEAEKLRGSGNVRGALEGLFQRAGYARPRGEDTSS